MNQEFWAAFLKDAGLSETTSIDAHLQGRPFEGDFFKSVRQLTDKREGVDLPLAEGTRVEFVGRMGAVLAYADSPAPRDKGVVVSVRTATGNTTDFNGAVFVQWSDGKVRAIHATHLQLSQGTQRKSQAVERIRVASLGDLTDFMKVAENTLIHKSTRDLWSLRAEPDGYVIERLFEDANGPIKS